MRYILEGTWSGYTSRQSRVVHREVITSPKRIERLKAMHGIQYTDGTMLYTDLREAKPRERVEEIKSYSSLIREAEAMPGDVVRVADLPSTRKTA